MNLARKKHLSAAEIWFIIYAIQPVLIVSLQFSCFCGPQNIKTVERRGGGRFLPAYYLMYSFGRLKKMPYTSSYSNCNPQKLTKEKAFVKFQFGFSFVMSRS